MDEEAFKDLIGFLGLVLVLFLAFWFADAVREQRTAARKAPAPVAYCSPEPWERTDSFHPCRDRIGDQVWSL